MFHDHSRPSLRVSGMHSWLSRVADTQAVLELVSHREKERTAIIVLETTTNGRPSLYAYQSAAGIVVPSHRVPLLCSRSYMHVKPGALETGRRFPSSLPLTRINPYVGRAHDYRSVHSVGFNKTVTSKYFFSLEMVFITNGICNKRAQ